MSRDELAFQILLKIMESPDLRESILNSDLDRALAINNYIYNPAAAFARVAWKQADEFIAAGVTDEERARRGVAFVPGQPSDNPDWRG